MINFYIDKMHPKYQTLMRSKFRELQKKYPKSPLKYVGTFTDDEPNRSLGNADKKNTILFNTFWFSKDPDELKYNAAHNYEVELNGNIVKWHGDMIEEPEHVICHEFGHVLSDGLVNWKAWATGGWKQATINPDDVASAYALTNPSEFWAENFAAFEMKLLDENKANAIYSVLKE